MALNVIADKSYVDLGILANNWWLEQIYTHINLKNWARDFDWRMVEHAWAIDKFPPPNPIWCHPLQCRPIVIHLFHLTFDVLPPCVSWSPFSSLSLSVGFHFSSCLVMLRPGFRSVCPIQPHFLLVLLICFYMYIHDSSWFIFIHSSRSLTLSCQTVLKRPWYLLI